MELILVAVGLWLLLGPILAMLALSRIRRAEDRIRDLTRQLARAHQVQPPRTPVAGEPRPQSERLTPEKVPGAAIVETAEDDLDAYANWPTNPPPPPPPPPARELEGDPPEPSPEPVDWERRLGIRGAGPSDLRSRAALRATPPCPAAEGWSPAPLRPPGS